MPKDKDRKPHRRKPRKRKLPKVERKPIEHESSVSGERKRDHINHMTHRRIIEQLLEQEDKK